MTLPVDPGQLDHSQDDSQLDDSQRLRALMQQADIKSYRALAAIADVSRWQIQQLRVGKAQEMRVASLIKLSTALKVSLSELLSQFGVDSVEVAQPEQTGVKQANSKSTGSKSTGSESTESESIESESIDSKSTEPESTASLRREYQRLQQQMAQQRETARSQFQTDALRTLETWLVQWPTIAKRAKDRGAELPAEKILPFIRPVEALMAQWGVEAIAPIDAQVPYDPQVHQLMGATANPGDSVTITHSGATYQGKLLHRAKAKK